MPLMAATPEFPPLPRISPELADYGRLQTFFTPVLRVNESQQAAASEPDWALGWVEDNWLMIAAALGGLILVSTLGGRRRR